MAPGDGSRLSHVFVLVALILMVVGAMLVLAARETYVEDVEPGASATVFRYTAPSWDPFGHPMKVTVHGPANVTLGVNDDAPDQPGNVTVRITTDADREVAEGDSLRVPADHRVTWEGEAARPGETWTVQVQNSGPDEVRVAAQVACLSYYILGGVLVGVGVLGFVVYRLGMR